MSLGFALAATVLEGEGLKIVVGTAGSILQWSLLVIVIVTLPPWLFASIKAYNKRNPQKDVLGTNSQVAPTTKWVVRGTKQWNLKCMSYRSVPLHRFFFYTTSSSVTCVFFYMILLRPCIAFSSCVFSSLIYAVLHTSPWVWVWNEWILSYLRRVSFLLKGNGEQTDFNRGNQGNHLKLIKITRGQVTIPIPSNIDTAWGCTAQSFPEVQNLSESQKLSPSRGIFSKKFPQAVLSSLLADQLYLTQNIRKNLWRHFVLFVTVRTT